MNEGHVVVDISALQSPESRGRGIARYALDWCSALERVRPTLVGAYVLNPALAPPGSLGPLIDSGKVAYRTTTNISQATIFHQLAPFDLSQSAATLLPKYPSTQVASATVYDLIPARDPAHELIDAQDRRRYRTRLELVRSLDHVQVLSDAVAKELVTILGVNPQRITNVGAAPHPRFVPPNDQNASQARARSLLARRGLHRPYVLYPSGSHPRKNNERLIVAWSRLPEQIRSDYQLVISGSFDASTINHFHHLNTSLGGKNELVVAGYLSDHELVTLVQGASLICFPSLAEGFGLPVAEAMACARPVIASAIAPLDELLTRDHLFDPTDENAIASAIVRALHTPVVSDTADLSDWDEIGQSSAAVFERLLANHRTRSEHRPLRRQRPQIAVVTPLPPAASGVARYSYRFLEAMAATEKARITCFCDGPTVDQIAPAGLALYHVEALQQVERLTGRFQQVVYVLGNSHHHLGALKMLGRRRGIVMSHDVRLTNLYRHAHGDPGLLPGGLGREIEQMYGRKLPSGLGGSGDLSEEELERYGLLMARDVISLSSGFFVTSSSAVALATVDASARSQHRIVALPFAMEAPRSDEPGFLEPAADRPGALRGVPLDLWGCPPPDDRRRYLAHFGIVDPIKQPDLLIAAMGDLGQHPDLRLIFVGPIADALAAQLVAVAHNHAILDRIGFTGPLRPAPYRAWLERAQLGIQLRATNNGEASAAVGECLATGLPTIVTNRGWAAELPRYAVRQVAPTVTPEELAQEINGLLQNTSLRNSIGDAGAMYARQHSFDYAARSLLHLLARRSAETRSSLALG